MKGNDSLYYQATAYTYIEHVNRHPNYYIKLDDPDNAIIWFKQASKHGKKEAAEMVRALNDYRRQYR